MNTRLPTHHDMMVVIRALIDQLGDQLIQAESPMQSSAKTQDVIVMALDYLGDNDIRKVVQSVETNPLFIDRASLSLLSSKTGKERNIYKYFDDLYTPAYGKSSRFAFEQADQTIAATSRELAAAATKFS